MDANLVRPAGFGDELQEGVGGETLVGLRSAYCVVRDSYWEVCIAYGTRRNSAIRVQFPPPDTASARPARAGR